MKITDYSIRHRLTVYVLMVILTVAGVTSYVSLPRESFPEVKIPLIFVYTLYPGTSPEDMESLVTRPIETELKGITGIKEIRSTSSEGLSTIEVEFNPEVDLDTALQKVREKVDLARSELPPDLEEDPRVQDVDVSQIPILVVSLAGNVGVIRLTDIAEDLKDDLEALPGVNRVQIIGAKKREVQVYVDPRRLSSYELSLSDLVAAVSRENLNIPGGEIEVGSLKYLVRLPAEVDDPEEIEDFVVKVRDGEPIYVRDVARVEYGFEEESSLSRVDGNDSVTLTVEKRTGANLIAVADSVKAELERQKPLMPEGTVVTILGDQSKQIRAMVSELENNVLSGLILVVGVLMAFMSFRNSIFVATAIPLSMLISFVAVQAMGYTLNMIVLFSLILVLGMLVDNAIVIVENIYRHREEGEDGVTAARKGTDEVAIPVITSTLTTLCAFAPMLIWPGIVGDFMSYLPVTLIIGLSASLAVALIFNPTFCAYFMATPKPRLGEDGRLREGKFLSTYRRVMAYLLAPAPDEGTRSWFLRNWALPLAFVVLACAGMSLALLAMLVETESPTLFSIVGTLMGLAGLAFALQGACWLVWTLLRRAGRRSPPYVTDRRSGTIWSMGAMLAVTFVAYGFFGRGLEFFPEIEPQQIFVDVEAPSGATLDTSNEIVRRIEERTLATRDKLHVVANVGSKGISIMGGDAFGGGGGASNQSRVSIDLEDREFRSQNSLLTLAQVREAVSDIEGAEIQVDKPAGGPQVGKPVTLRVFGDDFEVLAQLSQEIRERIQSVPGLVNLDDDLDRGKPELRLHVDRVEAMLAGLSTRDIATSIQTAVRGSDASEFRIGEDECDIVVRLAPEARGSLDDLGNLTVPDEDGIPVPLRALVRLEPGVGPAAIRRVDLKRVVTLDGDVVRAPGRTEDSVRQEVAARLSKMELPAGYRWTFAGSNEEEKQSQAFLQRAFVIAVLLILLVLVAQFDSILVPAAIMVSVMLSLIGVFWGLIFTATPFGIIMTGIGVISLAGVVVNNAIVLLDFVQEARARGVEKTEAVIDSGAIRMRPVLLTAVTTVLGLIPLTLGINLDFFKGTLTFGGDSSQWWGPMGVAVIFGLTVATVLTLVIVPVTYHSLDSLSGALEALPSRLRSRKRGRAIAEGAEVQARVPTSEGEKRAV